MPAFRLGPLPPVRSVPVSDAISPAVATAVALTFHRRVRNGLPWLIGISPRFQVIVVDWSPLTTSVSGSRNGASDPPNGVPSTEPGTNSAIVQLTDVFGYLADKAGLDPATDSDAVPFGSRREAVIEQRPDARTPTPPGYPRGDVSALVQWPYKYVEGPQEGAALFDLSLNQEEHVNLLTRDPTRAAAMSARLRVLSPTSSSSSTGSRPDAAIRERLRALGYIR